MGYKSVSIPASLYNEIRELIFAKDFLGYRSVPDFIREAIRRHLDHCKLSISSQSKEGRADLY